MVEQREKIGCTVRIGERLDYELGYLDGGYRMTGKRH